ncbi:MAG: hypothetical protein CVU41_03755 [Chloroflexi bacterium HGW-Chloroflexi-3]|nr:MAG: hypothetical protein CVU41_03755 [Chloroflexi bacterium HGW-Chloroflexi-3]
MKKKLFTIEYLIYGLILIIGIAFRFINLGSLPLSDVESSISLHAISMLSGEKVANFSDQTFLSNIQAILFFLFGNSNFIARLFPAVVGVLFILIPFLFRNYVNPKMMIILSFWIAISPTFISLSRQVDSTILFLFSIFLFMYFFIKQSVIPCAVFIVLSILSGKIFLMFLVPSLISLMYVYLFLNKQNNDIYNQLIHLFKSFQWKKFSLYSSGSYVILSTFGFIFPSQLSGIGYGINTYFNSYSLLSVVTLSDLVRGLFFYEIAAITFGLMGIIFIIRKNQIAGLFLTGMITFSILQIVSIPEKTIIMNVIIVMSLMISGSYFVNQFIFIPSQVRTKIIVVTLISLAVLFFISLAFISMFANPFQGEQENTLRIFFIIAGFALIIGAGLLAGWAISWEIAGKSFLLLSISYLLIFTISASVNASGLRYPYQNEILSINPVPLEHDLLVQTLENYSEWNYGDKKSLNIHILGEQPPSIYWVLRNFENISYGDVIPLGAKIDAIITNADQNLVQADTFRGQDILWTSKPAWSSMNANETTQWLLTRRAPQDMLNQKTNIIWIRNSLFPGTDTQ